MPLSLVRSLGPQFVKNAVDQGTKNDSLADPDFNAGAKIIPNISDDFGAVTLGAAA
jgi:hypothetical protein